MKVVLSLWVFVGLLCDCLGFVVDISRLLVDGCSECPDWHGNDFRSGWCFTVSAFPVAGPGTCVLFLSLSWLYVSHWVLPHPLSDLPVLLCLWLFGSDLRDTITLSASASTSKFWSGDFRLVEVLFCRVFDSNRPILWKEMCEASWTKYSSVSDKQM